MQGMLLAAGLGTRLRPLTDTTPKPAVRVGDKPLCWYALSHLAHSGVTHVVVNTHYLPKVLEDTVREHCPAGLMPTFSHEPVLLGTGGGIKQAAKFFAVPEGPVVVMNSDTIFAPDLQRAIHAHEDGGAIATMILRHVDDPDRWGSVEIDEDNRVLRLLGEPALSATGLRKLMFAGVHVLSRQALRDLPEQGCIIRHSYRRWVDTDARVLGVIDDSPWHDVGTLDAYRRVNDEVSSGALKWPRTDS